MSTSTGVSRPPSLRQLARLAGVSPATVSRVLADGDSVSPELRDRVRNAADLSGYRRAAINRVALGGRTDSVGILVPNLRNSYFADIVQGLQNKLLEHDILPMVLTSGGDDRRCVRRLLDHRVDAMILALTDESLHENDFEEVRSSGVPLLICGATHPRLDCDLISCDDVEGGYIAGQHLLSLGHQRIGFVYFGEGHSSCDERLLGFQKALHEQGLELHQDDIAHNRVRCPDEERLRLLHAELEHILSKKSRPTAIFAATDMMACEVYRVARALGLSIPTDLSIIGFADLDFTPYIEPPLTTIRQDGVALGEVGGNMILNRLKNPDATPQRHLQPVQLIKRDSTSAYKMNSRSDMKSQPMK